MQKHNPEPLTFLCTQYPVCVERAVVSVLMGTPQQALSYMGLARNSPYPTDREVRNFLRVSPAVLVYMSDCWRVFKQCYACGIVKGSVLQCASSAQLTGEGALTRP
jgi:hypothetical protein